MTEVLSKYSWENEADFVSRFNQQLGIRYLLFNDEGSQMLHVALFGSIGPKRYYFAKMSLHLSPRIGSPPYVDFIVSREYKDVAETILEWGQKDVRKDEWGALLEPKNFVGIYATESEMRRIASDHVILSHYHGLVANRLRSYHAEIKVAAETARELRKKEDFLHVLLSKYLPFVYQQQSTVTERCFGKVA